MTAKEEVCLNARHKLIPRVYYNRLFEKKRVRSRATKECIRNLETLNEQLMTFFQERHDIATENHIALKSSFRALCIERKEWPMPEKWPMTEAEAQEGEADLVQIIRANSDRPTDVDELREFITNFVNSIHAPEKATIQRRRATQSDYTHTER